jgi:hypothetical protein
MLVRRSARWAGRLGRLEVSGRGDIVHGEDYRAAPPPVLGGADEALGNRDLVGCLPCVAGCLAIRVAGAVRGYGDDRAGRRHPLCSVPPFVEVVDGYGPGGLRWPPALGRAQGGCDSDVHRVTGQWLRRRLRAEQV